jgi:hypothetical protein
MINLMSGELQCLKTALQAHANMPDPIRTKALADLKHVSEKMEIFDGNHARRLSSYLSSSLGKQPYDDDFILALRGRFKEFI